MTHYAVNIGLEVHAELNTATKIYCSCPNQFGMPPNTLVCPVCLGLPGTLPTLNREVVTSAVKMGHALHCRINPISKQARKNYFYPDLPKAYQITQAERPICGTGYLDFLVNGEEKRVQIQRIHIEEDAGKLLHSEQDDVSYVDYNRCGVPLIEIVTEPDMHTAAEARAFLESIRSILRYLGISDCKMQEGSIRCDVNVSLREVGSAVLGTRCEMKNVNSFSAAERGIAYEIRRQTAILEAGGIVEQETRRWDDEKGMSIVMRSKEDLQDYRYFPEPDLPPIAISSEVIENLRQELPELPNEKIIRYVQKFGLSYPDAVLLTEDIDKCRLFDACIALQTCSPKSVSNWILSDVSKFCNDTGRSIADTCITPEHLTALIQETEKGTLSSSAARTVFQAMLTRTEHPTVLIEELGLAQNSDREELAALAAAVVQDNPKSAADYRNGKKNALGYLVGQCMKASKGRANPVILQELLTHLLTEPS